MSERDTTAIVIGAGMAGLLTARVLSDHVDRVAVLERDRLPETAVTRRGVPRDGMRTSCSPSGSD